MKTKQLEPEVRFADWKRLHVYLPPQAHERLREDAHGKRVSMSRIVRELVEQKYAKP